MSGDPESFGGIQATTFTFANTTPLYYDFIPVGDRLFRVCNSTGQAWYLINQTWWLIKEEDTSKSEQ